METSVTQGIRVSVESAYQAEYSQPIENKFIFIYRITIENNSPYTVQLTHRHWSIFDSNGTIREIEGEGVIGHQPILNPGEAHEYSSWANLLSDTGKMEGHYTMVRQIDGEPFLVDIPAFQLIAPFKLN